MIKYNITSEDDLRSASEELFPGEDYSKALDLIQSIRRLAPTDKYRINYLTTLFTYVDGIINGDDIDSFMTKEHITKWAKEALDEVMDEVYNRKLESYRLEKIKLSSEVESLTGERDVLDAQVNSLKDNKNNLILQTTTLSTELEKLKQTLEEKRNNGATQIEEEIKSLNNEKDELTSYIDELKKIIDSHNRTISHLGSADVIVLWENVDRYNPLYGMNCDSIRNYINYLKMIYIYNMDVTKEVCEEEFRKNSPKLKEFVDLFDTHFTNKVVACSSITTIINHENWSEESKIYVKKLESYLAEIKLPRYLSKKNNDYLDIKVPSMECVSTNTNSILRELYFQRMAATETAKRKILESQVDMLTQALQRFVPSDYDISKLFRNTLDVDVSISDDDLLGNSPTLKL